MRKYFVTVILFELFLFGCGSMTTTTSVIGRSPDSRVTFKIHCQMTMDSGTETCASELESNAATHTIWSFANRRAGAVTQFVEIVWSEDRKKVCVLHVIDRNKQPSLFAFGLSKNTIDVLNPQQCLVPILKSISKRYGIPRMDFSQIQLEEWAATSNARSFMMMKHLLKYGEAIELLPISFEF